MPFDEDKAKDVASTMSIYDEMLPKWTRIATVLAGTDAMRQAGEQYLRKHSREGVIAYERRLFTNNLLNVSKLTLNSWTGRPFGKQVDFGDDVPEVLSQYRDNIDLQGTDVGTFLRELFYDSLSFGTVHVLIEFPELDIDEEERTVALDQELGNRPYWVTIRPQDVIFAHAETVGGVEVLTHLRIKENSTILNGFTEQIINKIRVYEKFGENIVLTIYVENEDKPEGSPDRWSIESTKRLSGQTEILFSTFYAKRLAFMNSEIPVLDLVDLNIEHWEMRSDVKRAVTAASFPILAHSGSLGDDVDVEIGPFKLLTSNQPGDRYYYVEHSGSAINVGMEYIRSIEDLMALYGAEFLRARPGTITVQKTATQSQIEEAAVTSPLKDMSLRFKDWAERLILMTLNSINFPVPVDGGGTITIDTSFSDEKGQSSDLEFLDKARTRRDLSREAYLEELIRREVLSEDFSAEDDLERVQNEPLAGGIIENANSE